LKASKPLFTWAGGKKKLLKYYEQYLPNEINAYCEPFFGGGFLFTYIMETFKPQKVVINDSNHGMMEIYRCIKDYYEEFEKHLQVLERKYLSLSKTDRKAYYFEVRHQHAWDYAAWSRIEEAATLYFLMKTGFNGVWQINKNTNGRYGTPAGLLTQKDKIYDRDVVKWWHAALQKVEIKSGDWSDALLEKSFTFFDPPYRGGHTKYGTDWSDHDLRELIAYADNQDSVFLSNRDLGDGFFELERKSLEIKLFPITYTAGRRKRVEGGFEAKKAVEVLLHK